MSSTTSSSLNVQLTDASLQQRLAIGVTSKAGAKGSLTRLATVLEQHCRSPTDKAAVIREVRLAQLELQKQYLQLQRLQEELNALDKQAAAQGCTLERYEAERQAVDGLQQELATAQAQQSCKRDLESLAEIALSKYPVSQRQLQTELRAVEEEIATTQKQWKQAQAEYNLRTAQVQNLLQSVMDLKQSLSEPVEDLLPVKSNNDNDEGDEEVEDDMDVEPTDVTNDDALYTDL